MRVALTISYNGTHFLGSQTQIQTKNTILGSIEQVLKQLGIHEKLIASGRTDKGVHALGQVCHINLPDFWSDLVKLKYVLNEMLSSNIHIKKIILVSEEFHARYSAKERTYRYLIKESISNPFEADFVTFLDDVDLRVIQKNIKLFIGKHDFKYFMKTGSDVGTTTRVIYKAFAYKHKKYLIITFKANGFLRSQIRLMIGALFSLDEKQIIEKLSCKHNHKLNPAPANGLYLARIKY